MLKSIVIDIRMIEYSGIGTYIKNIVPIIVNNLNDYKFIFLIKKDVDYSKFLSDFSSNNYKCININSDIYSLSEQIEIYLKIPNNILLYWAPHYNIPIFIKNKIIVTIHDIYHIVDKSFNKILRYIYCSILMKIINYKNCDIITVSKFSKNEILKYTSIKNSQIAVIYNGLDKIWNSTKNYYKNDNIVYVGNFKKHKNISLLINAFNELNKHQRTKLHIIGDSIKNLSRNDLDVIKNNVNISIINYMNKEKLIERYNSAKLFVFPSNYEGFGFPPLEAMACGLPVLATNTSAIPEICLDGAYYYKKDSKIDLIEKIEILIQNKKITDTLVENGYRVSKKYTWKKCSIKTIKKLKSILS